MGHRFLLACLSFLVGCAESGIRPATDAGRDAGRTDAGLDGAIAGDGGRDGSLPDAAGVDAAPPVDAARPDAAPPCTPAMCDDSNMCTTDTCGPDDSCEHATMSCDDGNACTMDSCAPATGCSHVGPVVPGDTCGTTIDVSAGGMFSGDSTCAASESSAGCGAGDAPDLYFRFTTTGPADVVIDTIGTSFDAVLSLGTTCAGGELGCDDNGGGGTHARIARTALAAGTYYAILDGKAGAAGGAFRVNVAITPSAMDVVLPFPSAGDTFSPTHGYLWMIGSFVQGSRSTALTSARTAIMHLVLAENLLTCDNQDMRMMVNGTEVGRFTITPGMLTIDRTFTFAAIAGPTYTLRYENVRQVASGCGSARPNTSGGTVTLRSI